MPEPISTILIAGAAGGIGKQLTEMTWSNAAKWIMSRYQDHAPEVMAKANANKDAFLNGLGLKVAALEQESEITKSLMAANMSEPNFSTLLQKAVLSSAQTASAEKHEVLSDIVSQRLKAAPESLYSVTSQMAVEAISHCTLNQLHVLGFAASIYNIWPAIPDPISEEHYKTICAHWLNHRYSPYINLAIGDNDFSHLESVSCLKFIPIAFADLNGILKQVWSRNEFSINSDFVYSLSMGESFRRLWNDGKVNCITLTTVGTLIGTLISDRLAGAAPTNFSNWHSV